jgi:hypothetical protein
VNWPRVVCATIGQHFLVIDGTLRRRPTVSNIQALEVHHTYGRTPIKHAGPLWVKRDLSFLIEIVTFNPKTGQVGFLYLFRTLRGIIERSCDLVPTLFINFLDNPVASEVSEPARAPQKSGRSGRLFPLCVERDYWQRCRRPSGPLNVVPGVQASPLWAA